MRFISRLLRQLSATPSCVKFVILCVLCAVFIIVAAFKGPAPYEVLGYPASAEDWMHAPILAIGGLMIFAWLLLNMEAIHRHSLIKTPEQDQTRYAHLRRCIEREASRPETANAQRHMLQEIQLLEHQHGFMLSPASTYKAIQKLRWAIVVVCTVWGLWLHAQGVDMSQFLPFIEWMK